MHYEPKCIEELILDLAMFKTYEFTVASKSLLKYECLFYSYFEN